MKMPRTREVPLDRVVRTLNSVGDKTFTTCEANMLPAICMATRMTARKAEIDRAMTIASVTAGLKGPPEMRKKTQTLTMSEKPNESTMYSST